MLLSLVTNPVKSHDKISFILPRLQLYQTKCHHQLHVPNDSIGFISTVLSCGIIIECRKWEMESIKLTNKSSNLQTVLCPFSLGHCVVCSTIYEFWLPLWYLQALLIANHRLSNNCKWLGYLRLTSISAFLSAISCLPGLLGDEYPQRSTKHYL
jgi:hypothetical protein